ncbi:MAG: hypothetical protein KIT22_00300 [Verrucomicrobiae bacterium]|nr:hypothetical protein [Verrucomicrobiae bacterium]
MDSLPSRSLYRFAVLTALATLGLIGMGGLVTSKGVGMAVPDWPTSFGYNMFALPVDQWFHGGVFDEHTHRLWASTVGLLVVVLARWLGGTPSRRWLLLTGAGVSGRIGAAVRNAAWSGAGHFLCGIGGVVLLAGLAWFRSAPAPSPLPVLGWVAFGLVQLQGLLGGLRVVLDQWTLGNVTLGLLLGLIHGCLGQGFFVLLGVIAWRLSPAGTRWDGLAPRSVSEEQAFPSGWAPARTGGAPVDSWRQHAASACRAGHSRFSHRLWTLVAGARCGVSHSLQPSSAGGIHSDSVQILLQMAHRAGAVAC